MAWVQIGTRKINSANICYMEQNSDGILVHFHGQWPGNPLEIKAEEAAALWKHLKADDPSAARDKGSTMVVPKRMTAPMPVSEGAAKPAEEKPKLAAQVPSGGQPAPSSSQPHRSSHSHSQSHSHSHSHSHSKPVEARKA